MNEPPKLLYHYASIEAFKGIINNEYLRMTKYDQLNDPLEVNRAREILLDVLKAYKCKSQHNKLKSSLVGVLDYYKDLDIFVTSFSEKANYLEQWRAYTPEGGISIGFDGKKLQNVEVERIHHPILRQCQYFDNDKQINKYVIQCINEWFSSNIYSDELSKLACGESSLMIWGLNNQIYNIICTIKHSAYLGEQEWRWVNINPNKDFFKKHLDEKNREYVREKIKPKDLIKEVWISPHGDKEAIRRVLEFYKQRDNLTFDIHESKIPYRL